MNQWDLFIAGIVVGYSVALLVKVQHRRRHRNEERRVRHVIAAYFRTYRLPATVTCVHSARGFFTLIECDASHKARFLAIRELAIVEHVKKLLGKDLRGVHWRFRPNPAAAPAADKTMDDDVPNYPGQAASAKQREKLRRQRDFRTTTRMCYAAE
ncbi:MAG: hypothetical protein H7X91_11610 [Burkholderiales bacterium]|nr:hypothetical protein [Burkholderiales bacterium]